VAGERGRHIGQHSIMREATSGDWLTDAWAFVRLSRPLFLTGGLVMHGLGLTMALYAGTQLQIAPLLWGQAAITAAQLATHHLNEYFDLPADRLNKGRTYWAGGSHVLPAGQLPPRVALIAAAVLVAIALGAALILSAVIKTGPLTMPLLLIAMGLAWAYSVPPLRLHSRGLGEFTVALVVPGLTPLIGFYLQTGRLGLWPVLAVLPLCLLQFAMMLSIEYPDAQSDAEAGKETLVVQLGSARSARLYVALPAIGAGGVPMGVVVAAGLGLPLAVWLAWRMLSGAWAEPRAWDSLVFWNITLLIGTALAASAGFLASVMG
jgi:1,4-dihydroxy-2-naphthoate octaprenyltransferase